MVKSLTSSELDKTLAHYESRGAGQLSNRTTENSLARFSAQIRGSFCNNPNASSRDQQARTLQRIDDALTKRSSFDHHNTQIDYEALKTQHAELITQGKNSVDIAQWIGHKLNISSWRAGAFHGERKVLPTPQPAEMERLQKFTEALGIQWTQANGSSDNHPTHLLLDGYVQNALFGEKNMKANDKKIRQMCQDWENMIGEGKKILRDLESQNITQEKYNQKMSKVSADQARYLLTQFGLDIKNNWDKLTGARFIDGLFAGSGGLYTQGATYYHNHSCWSMWLHKDDIDAIFSNAATARLCFLA